MTPPVIIIIGGHRVEFKTREEAILYLQTHPNPSQDPAGDDTAES